MWGERRGPYGRCMPSTPHAPSGRSIALRLGVVALATSIAGCAPAGAPAAATSTPASTPTVTSTPAPLATLPAAAVAQIKIDGGPNTIATSQGRLWVELHRANSIAAIDPTSMAATPYPKIAVHCSISGDGGDAVWAAYHQSNLLTRVDGSTGASTLQVTIPEACGTGVGDGQVWVTSPSENTVVRIDPTSGKALLSVHVPGTPFFVHPEGDLVYASGEGGGGWLLALDPKDGKVVATRTSPDVVLVDQVALAAQSLWVSGRERTSLLRLDPRTLATQASIEIGSEPSGVASFAGSIWVSQLSGTLTRIDPASNEVTGRWTLPYTWLSWPTPAFDHLWLTSLEEDAVIAIDPQAVPGH